MAHIYKALACMFSHDIGMHILGCIEMNIVKLKHMSLKITPGSKKKIV